MKYKITKEQIIKAVTIEPLTCGKFCKLDRSCEVCAVGAVLRHAGFKNKEISDSAIVATKYVYMASELDLAESLNNFLSILSCHHELFAKNHNSATFKFDTIEDVTLQRLHLLSVIEAFCPPVVEFEV